MRQHSEDGEKQIGGGVGRSNTEQCFTGLKRQGRICVVNQRTGDGNWGGRRAEMLRGKKKKKRFFCLNVIKSLPLTIR